MEQQLGAQQLSFPSMDKSGAAVCEFFVKAACGKGGMCPFCHISGEKTVVCQHWLRGLCKKGDQCEFLHKYDITKMLECYFYSNFCKHGPLCRYQHTRRVLCVNYLVGFCPGGASCKFIHPRFELPMGTIEPSPLPQQTQPRTKGVPQVIEVMQSQNSSAGTWDPGRWSKSLATSVVKKDTTPTDAPKGSWPFSVDS
ncbi:rCG64172, partial [Rattus norvegicus]